MCRSEIPHHDGDDVGGGGCAGGSLYDYGDIITGGESSVPPPRREGERTRAREREREGRGREERSRQGWMLARARERWM